MNITKEDIRKALKSGSLKWSDVAGRTSDQSKSYAEQDAQIRDAEERKRNYPEVPEPIAPQQPTAEQETGTRLAAEANSILPQTDSAEVAQSAQDATKVPVEPLKTSEKATVAPSINPKSLIGKSFRDYASMLYDNQLFSIDTKKETNLKPELNLTNTLNDNANNPELYKLLDAYSSKNKQSLLYDPDAPGAFDPTQFRKLDNYEVPSDLVEANNKFGDQIVDWSKAAENNDNPLPKLSEVLSGKNVNNTSSGSDWYSKQISGLEERNNIAEQDKMTIQSTKDLTVANDEDKPDETTNITNTTPIDVAASAGVNKLTHDSLSTTGVNPVNDYLIKNNTAIADSIAKASLDPILDNGKIPEPTSPYDVVSNTNISMPFNANKIYKANPTDNTLFSGIKKSAGLVTDYINQGATDQLNVGYGVQKPEGVRLGSMWLAPEAKLGAEGKVGKLDKQDYPISDWVSQNISEGLGQSMRGFAIGLENMPNEMIVGNEFLASTHAKAQAEASKEGMFVDPWGNKFPSFMNDKSNKTLAEMYGEEAKSHKGSQIAAETKINKAEEQLPNTWQAHAGGMVPLAGVTIGGIVSGHPELAGGAITALFASTGYGSSINMADQYEKQTGVPISDAKKNALGFGTGLIYALPLGKLASGLGGIIKKTSPKVIQESVLNFIAKNPAAISEAGEGIFKSFADQMPGAAKSFAINAGKGAAHSVVTMEAIGAAQNFLNQAVIGKKSDWAETLTSGLESGLMFSLATIPFAHASYASRAAMFKNATDSNGDVSLSVTNDGKAVYVTETKEDANGEKKTFGYTVDGKRVELNEEEVGRTFTMTSQHLKDELASYKKTKTVSPNLEQTALENRVHSALEPLTVDGAIPVVRSPEKGMQIVTGESANGSAIGVNTKGEKDYISKEAVPEKAKYEDVFNEIMAEHAKRAESAANEPVAEKPVAEDPAPKPPVRDPKGFLDTFGDTIESEPLAPVAVAGVGSDSRYQDETLHNNAMIHLSGNADNEPAGTQAINNANNIINAGVIHDMKMHDRIKKTESYINAFNNKKSLNSIQYLTRLAKNPPVGVDPQDIQDEIKLAKQTLSVYKDKSVMGYANRAGGVGSENHKLLTSLIVDHENSAKHFDDVKNELMTSVNTQKQEIISNTIKPDLYSDYALPEHDGVQNPIMLFDALNDFESLKNITIENNSNNEHAKRKHKILNYELDKKREAAAKFTHDMLVSNGIIGPLNAKDISFENMSRQIDKLDLPGVDKGLSQTLALSHISDLSGKYESTMSKLLANKKVGFNGGKAKEDEAHDIFVDKMLDAYRTSRKKEVEAEKTKQMVDEVKTEDDNTPEPPTQYESNSDLISEGVDEVQPQDTELPDETPPSPNKDEGVQNESAGAVDDVTPIKDNDGNTVTTSIESPDEDIENVVFETPDPVDTQDQDTIIADEKPDMPNEDNEAAENKEVIKAIESSDVFDEILDNEDTGAFNQLIEEMPGLASTNSIKHDRISRTIFANVNLPVIRDFLMDPIAFKSADVRIIVNRHNSGMGDTYTFKSGGFTATGLDFVGPNNYDIKDESTWDNAYIKVQIEYKKDGETKTIAFNMKNPGERELVTENSGMLKYSASEVQALRDFRNSIISEQAKVIADPTLALRMLHGFQRGISKLVLNRDANGLAVQRGLHEVVGLLDEPDVNKLGVTNLTLAYGRGSKGSNLVVSLFETVGTTVDENAGSIFITKTEPFDANSERKIKINKKKIGYDKGASELIYKLAIDMFGSNARQITISPKGEVIETDSTSPYGLTPAALLNRIVGFGEATKVNPESSKQFLEKKQFFVENGVLNYGGKTIQVSAIGPNEKKEILSFIENNLTWNVNKDDLWNRENNTDNTVSDLFPGIKAFFARNPGESTVKFTDGISIGKEDLDITWTAWLIKNKKLTSDIGDGVFEPPFLFMTNVAAVSNGAEKITPVVDGAYNTSVTPVATHEILPDPTEVSQEQKEELPDDITLPVILERPEARSLDDFDDFGAPRMIDEVSFNVPVMDQKKAVDFLREKLGEGFDIKEVEDAIALSNGGFAMGLTKGDSIDLYRLAGEGTEFHEAYHRAELLLIPRKRRMRIYDSIRKSSPEFENATDIEIGEYLAEGFRERLMTGVNPIGNSTYVNIMFRKIYNAFNTLSNFDSRDIDRLYRDIEKGVFKDVKPSFWNKEAFADKFHTEGAPRPFKEAKLQTIKTVEAKDKLVNSLTYYLFEISGIQTIDDISKLNYAGLKDSMLASVNKTKGVEGLETRHALYQEVYDRFDDYFLPAIKADVKNTGITEHTPKDGEIDESVVGKEVQEHDKASYEISKRDNIRAEVKFFIRTIPETEVKNNTAVVKRDAISNFPSFVEFELAWNTMIYELHKQVSPELMKKKIELLAHEKKNPFFIMLENRLSKMDDNFITKFWNTMYSHRHDYVNTVYNANSAKPDSEYNRSIRSLSSNIDRATRVLPILWGQNMMSAGYIYTVTDDGLVFNHANAEAIITEYAELAKSITKSSSVEDTDKALDSFIGLLNRTSIDVDRETMEYILDNNYPGFTRQRATSILIGDYKDTAKMFTTILPQLIKANGAKNKVKISELTPKVLLGGEKSIKNYAKIYAQTHPNPQEIMVPGADGSNLYQISSRNFVTDVIDKVSNNAEYLKSMLSVPINQGSILLNQINNGTSKGISFGTFVKIYEEGVADQGRDYFDISPMEDYTIKMSNLLDSNITLPAMADKKTYGFIFGIKLPDMVSSDKNSQKLSWHGNTISYPSEVIDIFDGYYKAEFNAIKQAWAKYKEENGNQKVLINNYHYRNDGKWASGHGDGLRFRYLDTLHVNSKTVGDEYNGIVNLNDYIDRVITSRGPIIGNNAAMDEAIDRLDKKFFSETYENKTKMISSTLTAATKHELDYAEEIGLITRTTSEYAATIARDGVNIGDIVKSTIWTNKAIDAALLASNIADYTKAGIAPSSVEKVAITNIMANTAINSIISEFETDKLISKDIAFYKGSDDKTKRLSSVLSTGTALRNSFPVGHPLNGITSFNVAELSDSIIRSTEIGEVKNKSYAAQVNRLLSQQKRPTISNLSELYSNPEMKAELDVARLANKAAFELGEKIIDNQSKAYEKVNVTDATVYISPYMYRSIMTRLGEDYFTPEVEEAFKLLESDDLSWMDNAADYEKVSQLALHPLKMVYFGDSFEIGLNPPKLDKMAMFLLPKFMATGDLSNLYDRMNNPKPGQQRVDMAPFSSAVKTYNDNPVSIHAGENGELISSLNDLKVAQQSFEFLRHQLPTTPHESDTMAVATQVQKASMGNIVSGDVYPNIVLNGKNGATGTELKQEWVSALNELSDRGKVDVENKFGLKKDANGDYQFNTKKMYDFLTEEAENSGMPSDVTEMLASFNPERPMDMPLQALVDGAFVESKILSHIVKNTVDVKTPGGMFIQMTPFGLKSFNANNTQYSINGGKKLKFLNPDGSMDVVVSMTMFKDILPKELTTHNEQIQWLTDNNIIGENAEPAAIGYRIPTQGLSSIISARFVDVLPMFMGDTVILPDEFTALTGSDFDVDKLYMSRYNYVKQGDRFIKASMDDSKVDKFKNNSTKAIQNRFIDTMLAVISNPASINETRIPLDAVTDPVKAALKEIDKYIKDDSGTVPFAKSRLSYESKKKMEYAGGKGGIPTFALAGVHHVLTQIAELKFKNSDVVNKFNIGDIAKINGMDGLRILDWLSAMVNAHVDVAKDPYIIRMGVNQNTYKMTALLLRGGYGEKTFFFLSQPALKDIYKILSKKGSEYLTGNRTNDKPSIDTEIRNAISTYQKLAAKTAITAFDKKKLENLYEEDDKGFVRIHNESAFDRNFLVNNMARTNTTGFDHAYSQLVILETYKELSKYASALSELVKYSQVDTKKAGNTFAAQRLFSEKVEEIKNDPKSVFENVNDFYNNTFIYNKLVNSAGLAKNLSQGVFFRSTKSVEKSTTRILDSMGRRRLDNRDMVSKVNKYMDTKIKSKFFDQLAADRGVSVPKMFFGEHTMAKRLFSIQQRFPAEIKDNYFLRSMAGEIYSRLEANRPDQIRPRDNNTNEPGLTEKLKQHYSSAVDSDNKEISDFAKDFLLYQFYSTGDNHASNTVKISEYDRKDTGYYKFISDKLDELSNMNEEALSIPDIVDIYTNRWYDNDLVPTVQHFTYTDEGKKFMPAIGSTKHINGISYPLSFFNTGARSLPGLDKNEFLPFIKIQMFPKEDMPFHVLYRLYGTHTSEENGHTTPMYVAIDKKGSKKDAISMIEHNVQHSMVKNNILPQSLMSKHVITGEEWNEAASLAGPYLEMYKNVQRSNILSFPLQEQPEPIEITTNQINSIEPTTTTTPNTFTSVQDERFTKSYPSAIDGMDSNLLQKYLEAYNKDELVDNDMANVSAFESENEKFTDDVIYEFNHSNIEGVDTFPEYLQHLLDTNEKISDANQFLLFNEDGTVNHTQIETINEGFKRSGLEEMTKEQFNSMDKALLESLKACFGA